MATAQEVVLAKRPTDSIIADETFRLEHKPAPSETSLEEGQVLLQTRYLSIDPAMRGWLNDTRSYLPPVQIGEVMRGYGIGVVKASKSVAFPPGTIASGMVGWRELAVVSDKALTPVVLPKNARLTDPLGVLGITGLTAYFGLIDVGNVKAGDFVVVSGAAGATGSVVGQIAKIKGARVLGLAGSDDKVQWLKELGFDDALNYKQADFADKFKAATEGLIDVYFDNVGGDILDLALSRAKPHARFVMCGGISQYNSKEAKGPKNYLMIIAMRIRMQGFIVLDYEKDYPKALKEMAQWLEEGKLQRRETIIKGGLQNAAQALVDLYKGVNTGKLLVEVTPDDGSVQASL